MGIYGGAHKLFMNGYHMVIIWLIRGIHGTMNMGYQWEQYIGYEWDNLWNNIDGMLESIWGVP